MRKALFIGFVSIWVGGFAVSSLMLDVYLDDQLYRFAEHVSIPALLAGVLKSACFGLVIALSACTVGLDATRPVSRIPVAPAQAFLWALLAVITVNLVFLVVLW